MYNMCMPSAHEKGVRLPETELQMAVNQHVGTRNQTQVLYKNSNALTTASSLSCQPPIWVGLDSHWNNTSLLFTNGFFISLQSTWPEQKSKSYTFL